MFNAYAVLLGNQIIAYFRTETAAENFVQMYQSMRSPQSEMAVVGQYVVGLSF